MQRAVCVLHALNYFFGLPPALEDEYVCIDVFNTNPAGERQSGVGPNPIHHRPQLRQEGNQTKPGRGELISEINCLFW